MSAPPGPPERSPSELSTALSALAVTKDHPLGHLNSLIKWFYVLRETPSGLEWWLSFFLRSLSKVIIASPGLSDDENSLVSLLKTTCYRYTPDDCQSEDDLIQWPHVEGEELDRAIEISGDLADLLEHKCFIRSGGKMGPTQEGKEAIVKSWDQEFLGSTGTLVHDILHEYMRERDVYARVVQHMQSSGTGKSRVHDELAKSILYIPLNLAAPFTTTYPPRDPRVQRWFSASYNSGGQERIRNRCHAFLHALLSNTLSRLRGICDDKAVAREIRRGRSRRLAILASEFRDRMSKGRTFEIHGAYRRKFYHDVFAQAEENVQTIDRSDIPNVPECKLPVSAASSEKKDAAGQPKSPGANEDNKMATKTKPLFNDNLLTIEQVAKEIIHLLDPHTSPCVVICWDESDSLFEPIPKKPWNIFSELRHALRTIRWQNFMSVFLSTRGEFRHSTPSREYHPSARLMYTRLNLLPPITEVSFDQFTEKVDCMEDEWYLERIASTHHIAHLGRALFPTRFDNGDDSIKGSIVTFAVDKLLCQSSKGTELKPDESLACLAVRLGVDFKATSWLDRVAERNQVERHMRLCLTATEDFRTMVTISPSEPLLAEASSMVMRTNLGPKEAPKALLMHINESYLNPGDHGEGIAALLLLLARDKAIEDRHSGEPPKDLKSDGEGRIVTVLEFVDALVPRDSHPFVRGREPICSPGHSPLKNFASAFADAHIYFNHFIKVYDPMMVNREYLWRLICRGAAVIWANNHRGVDILIPVLMGKLMRPQFVTAIFVQVKNIPSFTNKVCTSLFRMMDPLKVGLFSEEDAKAPSLPPVLRIVLALASERSGVTAPTSTPCPKERKFTAYDLWIAGVSSQSFGVIPDEDTFKQYKLLVDRTRSVFDYRMLAKDEELEERIDLRRMMHPATASEDEHYQNYIGNLARVPTTYMYVVKDYVKELAEFGDMNVDQSEPVDGGEESDEDVGASTSDEDTMDVDHT